MFRSVIATLGNTKLIAGAALAVALSLGVAGHADAAYCTNGQYWDNFPMSWNWALGTCVSRMGWVGWTAY